MTYLFGSIQIRCVLSSLSKKWIEIKPLKIVSAGMYTNDCFMTEEQEKVTGWTIDMHLWLITREK